MNNAAEHGWWVMGWGWIISLIVLLILIWIIVSVTRQYTKTPRKSSLDVLKDRYARGELSKAEFEEKKQDLL